VPFEQRASLRHYRRVLAVLELLKAAPTCRRRHPYISDIDAKAAFRVSLVRAHFTGWQLEKRCHGQCDEMCSPDSNTVAVRRMKTADATLKTMSRRATLFIGPSP
jgi:hypothetical protein